MKTASIYQPIEAGMLQVEESLRAVYKLDFSPLAEIVEHVLRPKGKRIRPALALLAGKFHNYNLDLLIPMATGVELLHTATLVHDDTIDNSLVRRGTPTVNSLWSKSTAVLAGDYLFARAADLVSTTDNVRVMRLFAQALMSVCNGELFQSFSTYDWQQTRQDYYARIGSKTAALFSLATESGSVLSGAPEHAVQSLKSYGYNLGMAFQIVDDILDFTGEEQELGKPVGNDLLQGVLTLPAILFLEKYPEGNPIGDIFENRDKQEDWERVIELISNSPVIVDSYRIAAEFCSLARQTLSNLPDSESRRSLIDLSDYVVARNR